MERLHDLTSRMDALERAQEFAKGVRDLIRGQRSGRYSKAAVALLESTDPLASSRVIQGFLSVLSQRTLIGRLPFRRADLFARVPIEIAPGSAGWIEEAEPIAVSKLQIDVAVLSATKIAGICIFTDELIEGDSANNLTTINASMLATIGRYQDRALLDPALTAVAQTRPASLTAAGTQVSVSGDQLAAIIADVTSVLTTLTDSGADLSEAVLAMHPQSAVYIARLMLAGGLAPTLGARGGELLGVPVFTSVGAVATGSPSERVIAGIIPSGVVTAEGSLEISAGKFASLQQSDVPSTGPQATTSMFQTGSTPLRFTRTINWASAAAACAYLTVGY